MPKGWRVQTSWLVFAAGGLLLIAGCGKKTITVEGDVTWQGKPVESGSISFVPSDNKGPSLGGKIKDGKYRLEGEGGLTPGKKNVTITATQKTGKQIEAGPPAPAGTMVDDVASITFTQSCDIAEGKVNKQDFEVQPAKATR